MLRRRRRVLRSPTGVHLALGATFVRTGQVLIENLLPFTVIGLLFRAPLLLRALGRGSEDMFLGFDIDSVGLLGAFLAGVLIQCLVIPWAYASLNRVPRGRKNLFVGLRSAPSVLSVGILAGGLAWMSLFFASVVGGQFAAIGPSFRFLAVPVLLLGCLAALMVYATYFVGAPAVLVEHLAPTAAMGRSAWITKGSLWIVLLFVVVPILGLRFGGWVLLGPWNQELLAPVLPPAAMLGVKHLVGMGLSVLQAVLATVVYHDLRTAKEGASSRDLIDVFK